MEDRERRPLWLPTHVACNAKHSLRDQQIGQLVALLHRENPKPSDVSALRGSLLQSPDGDVPAGVIEALPVRQIVARWVQGFHAALYGEALRAFAGGVYEPFPGSDDLKTIHPVTKEQYELTKIIQANRLAGTLDEIDCYNGRCRYVCTWTVHADRSPICVFALNLYDWERLGTTDLVPARSCVGWYKATPSGRPQAGSQATTLAFRVPTQRPLDAF